MNSIKKRGAILSWRSSGDGGFQGVRAKQEEYACDSLSGDFNGVLWRDKGR